MAAGITGVVLLLLAAGCLANDFVLDRLVALEKQNIKQEIEISGLKARLNKQATNTHSTRALHADGRISFTSYLSHDLDNVARNTTIVFDSVLHNDGDAYDNSTGYFTAPIPGVYFFTYFIGQMDDQQINTMLTVNHVNYVDAIAEGIAAEHNAMGGNAAAVRLSAGDFVCVRHRKAGHHLEGAPGLKITTFSGFLIYNVEDIATAPVIIG